jgi:regulatory protein YycH of two-component signal transduction system YycFG
MMERNEKKFGNAEYTYNVELERIMDRMKEMNRGRISLSESSFNRVLIKLNNSKCLSTIKNIYYQSNLTFQSSTEFATASTDEQLKSSTGMKKSKSSMESKQKAVFE